MDGAYIAPSPVSGSGLFSSREIEAGGLILSRDKPTFAALDTLRLPEACSNCFACLSSIADEIGRTPRKISLKVCTGCKTLRYCSKKCQATSWPEHKKDCKLLGQLAAKGFLPNAARLVLQMLTSYKMTNELPLQELHLHLPEIVAAGGSRHETLQFFSMGLYEYTGKKVELEFFRRCFALIYTNALTVNTPTFDPLGICVDEFTAKANHSCDPNAFVVFDGVCLSLRALKPISLDEEIFISYVDGTDPFARRQKELSERYYFTCKCSKCAQGARLAEDAFLSAQVPDDVADTERLAFSKLDQAKAEPDPIKALKHLDEGLRACLNTKVWPQRRQPIPSLRQEIFVNLLSAKRWKEAFRQGFKHYFTSHPELYPEPFHPLRVVQKWALANLALFLADQRDNGLVSELEEEGIELGTVILGLLTEVADNVRLSHGRDHSFAHEVRAKCDEVVVDMSRDDPKRIQLGKERIPAQWDALRKFASSGESDLLTM